MTLLYLNYSKYSIFSKGKVMSFIILSDQILARPTKLTEVLRFYLYDILNCKFTSPPTTTHTIINTLMVNTLSLSFYILKEIVE